MLFAFLLAGSALYIFRQCASPTHYQNLPPTALGDWIAFGDSLTAGTGASEGQDYPTRLAQALDIPLQNWGVPGHTTQDGLNRLAQACAQQPRVVLLCLGGNDSLQSLPVTQTFANLAAIIDGFHQSGAFVVLIGVRSASWRDRHEKHFQELARQKKVLYVADILDGIFGHPALMSDYIHPNDAGYQVMADRLEKILRPFLPQLRK